MHATSQDALTPAASRLEARARRSPQARASVFCARNDVHYCHFCLLAYKVTTAITLHRLCSAVACDCPCLAKTLHCLTFQMATP
jgi:hypothetical protein